MEQKAFFMSFALFLVLPFQSFHLTLPLAKKIILLTKMHHFKRVLFCVFFLSSIFGVGLSYAQQCNSGRKIGSDVTSIWRTQSGDGVPIPDLPSGRYALINVIKGIQYEINANYIKVCDGIREVSLSANYGTLFSPQRNFIAPVSGQLRVYYTGSGSGLQIKAIGGQNTTDTKDVAPNQNNRWRIHFYGEQNIAPENGIDATFQNYLGYRDENESFRFFSSHFANSITPIGVFSNNVERLKVLNYFSTKAFMKTTRKGLYYVTLGADDGTRLSVNNQPVYDNWRTSRSTGYKPVENQIIKLTGDNTLHYEYFNKGVPLEYLFQISDSNKIIENTISGEQTICQGGQASPITGDDFNRRTQHDFNPTFQFQWHYATNPDGSGRTSIAGATQKDFTPNTQMAPFNQVGTFYLFREASVRFKNIGMSEKTESILSSPVRINVLNALNVSIKPSQKKLCQGDNAEIQVVVNNGSGGTPPFTLSYKINGVTSQIQSNENTFNIPINSNQAGTFKYEYVSINDGNGCPTSIHKTDNITINPLPTATFLEENTTLCLNTPEQHITWATFTGTPPFTVRVKGSKTGGTSKEDEEKLENNQNRLVIKHNPNDIGEFTYEILWVRDANGCYTYFTNQKKVVNVVAPSITAPENVVRCLPEIVSAVYDNSGNTIITENSYVLPLGDTALDVVVNSVPCCPNPTLKWTINNDLSNTRTGQPSTLGNISFENATSSDKIYTITYWLECNGQKYDYVTRQVRITPRPNLEFQ